MALCVQFVSYIGCDVCYLLVLVLSITAAQ